ncbi:MAG: trigger factor [Candidatus Saccharimonadaceae bacterium]
MKTTVKNLSDTKVELTIILDTEALANAEKVALLKLSKTVKVPGFRKGKVPASVAAKHVDPQALQEQLLDDAISRAVAEAFLAEKIQALERPSVDIKKYVAGDLLEFTAEVEILPPVKLGDYKKLNVKVEKSEVTEADVSEVIERMRKGFAEKKEVTRAAKDGDETVIDFVGKKDDVPFDGGTGTDYTLTLGSGQFIPGFEAGVVGHKTGETFDIELTFPEDYHAKDLAGQKVTFTTTLKKIVELVLPKVDDELGKKAGDFKTLKELKADIRNEIDTQKEREASEKLKDDLIAALIAKSTVPAPEVLVADQMRSIEQDFSQNLAQRGLDLVTYLESNSFADEDDWREKEVKPTAIKRTQAGLVLNELSKVENITATDAEIDEHVEVHKRQYANNPEVLKQFETEEVRRDIANHYVTEKAISRLVELNGGKVTPHN